MSDDEVLKLTLPLITCLGMYQAKVSRLERLIDTMINHVEAQAERELAQQLQEIRETDA